MTLPLANQHQPRVPAFKRTAASCLYCQLRKVRCDRKILGSPCTNCRLDNINCMPGHSKTKAVSRRLELRKSALSNSPHSEKVGDAISHGPSPSDQATIRPNIPDVEARLPCFIKPLPSHLTAEDTDYLRHKGIFQMPDAQSRNEILRSYVEFVHPLLPLLDLESFLGPMVDSSQSGTVSLLLFYAVMCSGAAHVHIDSLQALGYNTRKSARRAFFEKARLLFDFDCEPDHLGLVQASLLLTYWYDTSMRGRHKDRKFWIRESVTLAQDLGLNLDLENCNTKRRRLLKRVWWCCFMRDQFVALMTWTPPQFRAGYRNIPMLVLDDFELQEFPELISHEFSEWAFINSEMTRIQLAKLCIEKAKLCLCIDQILQVRYTSLRHESEDQTITILVPKRNARDLFEVIEHDHQLQQWYQGISDSGNFDLRDTAFFGFSKAPDMVTVHRAHLKLLFLSALIALHRPQVLDNSRVSPGIYQQLSRTKLREAADEVGHLAMCMKQLQMGTHMRPKGVTLFLPILLVHLQDITPEMDNRQGNRLSKYHHCMQILDSIGDRSISEEFLPVELETAFRELNILPSQETKFPPTIPHMIPWQDSSIHEGGISPYLSHLGTITSTELNLLTELSHHLTTNRKSTPISDGDKHEINIDHMDLTEQIL